jgi:hypothetical protein
MASFASAEEFEVFLGRTFTPQEHLRAEQALTLATGLIQTYTGQHLFHVEDDTVQLWPRSPLIVVLPEMPVTEVAEVLDRDSEPVTGWELRPGGVLRLRSGRAPVTVTYSHGYVTIPDSIKEVTMRTAQRLMVNPGDVRQESVGSYSVTYGSVPGLGDSDRHILGKFRMPMVV